MQGWMLDWAQEALDLGAGDERMVHDGAVHMAQGKRARGHARRGTKTMQIGRRTQVEVE